MIGHERFQHLVDRESGAAGAACGLRETRLHAKIPGTEAALVHSSFLLQELGRARNPRLRHTTSLPDNRLQAELSRPGIHIVAVDSLAAHENNSSV